MVRFHVPVPRAAWTKCSSTWFSKTTKWLFASMNPRMLLESTFLSPTFTTVLACVRPLPSMHTEVDLQMGRAKEFLFTIRPGAYTQLSIFSWQRSRVDFRRHKILRAKVDVGVLAKEKSSFSCGNKLGMKNFFFFVFDQPNGTIKKSLILWNHHFWVSIKNLFNGVSHLEKLRMDFHLQIRKSLSKRSFPDSWCKSGRIFFKPVNANPLKRFSKKTTTWFSFIQGRQENYGLV